MGGEYSVWIPDDGNKETRAILYKLENLRLIKQVREKENKGI